MRLPAHLVVRFVVCLRSKSLAVATCLLASAAAQSEPAMAPHGRWITASGNLEVDIGACGAALCGTVTRVLGNRSMRREGAAMEAVDARPALGLQLLTGFVPTDPDDHTGQGQWEGAIYNRENGKTYRCRMWLGTASNPAGELLIRPYVGLPLFGQTQRWQRADAMPATPGQP